MNVRDDMIALFKQQEASIRLIQEKLGVQVPGLNEERKATLENIEEELSERLSIREANALAQQGLARMESRNGPQVAPSIKSAKYSLRSLSSSIIEKGYLKKRIKEISNTLPQVRDHVFRQNTIGWLNQFKKLENITCDMNVDDAIHEAVRILKVFRSTKKVTYISAAKDLIRLGEALRALDMPEQARVMYEWGVHLCCELAVGRGSKMMELVKFLGNLVASFRSNQRLDDAWGVMDQAVEIGDRLPQQEQKAYLAALAPILAIMERLETVEQLDAWFKTGKQVATKYYTLGGEDRNNFLSRFSRKFHDLALNLYDTGRPDIAVKVVEEAIEMGRELVENDRRTHLPRLSSYIHQLALYLDQTGRSEDAVKVVEEAIDMRRELVEKDRRTHLPNLSLSVHQLAFYLDRTGRSEDAVKVVEEAIEMGRELVENDRRTHLPRLSLSVHQLAYYLDRTGRSEDAVKVVKEAIEMRRELVEKDRRTHLPRLSLKIGGCGESGGGSHRDGSRTRGE
ncbi:hypothetical protein FRC02_007256 [Tulasnella sp. 418]|nr:hypothetical protein FRC02_007256 [Tulasnella sp. 418]